MPNEARNLMMARTSMPIIGDPTSFRSLPTVEMTKERAVGMTKDWA